MSTFSVTERASAKTCEGMWLRGSLNHQGIEPTLPNNNLLLGSLVHYTFADWIKEPSLDPVLRFDQHWAAAELDILGRYERKFGSEMYPEEIDKRYGDTVRGLGHAMVYNYQEFYGAPLAGLERFKVVETEQTVTVAVPGTEHCIHVSPKGRCFCKLCRHSDPRNCQGVPFIEPMDGCPCCVERHSLEGTFDAFLMDTKNRIWIVDHKTYSRKPGEVENAENDQFLAYTWMGNQAFGHLGGKVMGVIYNGLWKRTWEDLLDKKTGKPRKKTGGDPYEFGDLFFRDVLPRDEEVRTFGPRLAQELLAMANPIRPPILNPAWYSCPNCGFRDACIAERRGEPVDDLLEDYIPRVKSPAWRSLLPLDAAVAS